MFYECPGLTGVYFQGNAPRLRRQLYVLINPNRATNYYLPGTKDWGKAFAERPTAEWKR